MNAIGIEKIRWEYPGRFYMERLDDASKLLLTEIYDIVSAIAPMNNMGDRRIWCAAPRGEYEQYKEWALNVFRNAEAADKYWKQRFFDEEVFFCITFRPDYYLFIDDSMVISGMGEKSGFVRTENWVDFFEWLKKETMKTIDMLSAGTYKDYIQEKMSYRYIGGIIPLSRYWEYCPEEREKRYEELGREEVNSFIQWVDANIHSQKYYEEMTAGQYYDTCMFLYKIMGYNTENLTPKEAYQKFSDGRNHGLTALKEDDADAFRSWYDITQFGDHIGDFCSGVCLVIYRYESGYVYRLSNFLEDREEIHLIVSMIQAGYILDASYYEWFRKKLIGDCMFEIVPCNRVLDYKQIFENKEFSDSYIGRREVLPVWTDEALLDEIHWLKPYICRLDAKHHMLYDDVTELE